MNMFAAVRSTLDLNSALVYFESFLLIVSRLYSIKLALKNSIFFHLLFLQDFFHFCSFTLMHLGEKIKPVLQRDIVFHTFQYLAQGQC